MHLNKEFWIFTFLLWMRSCGLILAEIDSTPFLKANCTQICESTCDKSIFGCIFEKINCSIDCQCMNRFIGQLTEDLAIKKECVDNSYKNVDEIWKYFLLKISTAEYIQVDNNYFSELILDFSQLVSELLKSKQISTLDIHITSNILGELAKMDSKKLQLDEKRFRSIIKIFDNLIDFDKSYMSQHENGSSILKRANKEYENSSINLFHSLDELTAHIAFKEKMVNFSSDNFYIKASSHLNPYDLNFPLSIYSYQNATTENPTLNLYADSISLNHRLLIHRYQNSSIKVSLRILFNSRINKNNIFYELTKHNETNSNTELLEEYVPSNILSAVIYDNNPNKIPLFQSPDIIEDKLVRIQFIIDLNSFNSRSSSKQLKCVFWSFKFLEWLTHGCFVSEKESWPIINTSLYRKVCYCDHLNHFAIIFDPEPDTPTITQQFQTILKQILSILTLIGHFVSFMCYISLIIAICCCGLKNQNSSYCHSIMNTVYLSKTICLLCANICFLVLSNLQKLDMFKLDICFISATGFHYFLLSAFCFSLVAAWEHFKRLVRIFSDSDHNSYSFELMLVLSVIFPFALALTGIVYNQTTYPDYQNTGVTTCWLKPPYFYNFFVIPITLTWLVSFSLYIFVLVEVTQTNTIKQKFFTETYNQEQVIIFFTVSFISLGLSWLFGVLIVVSVQNHQYLKFIMDFLFCFLNAFHALSLLTAHVIAHDLNRNCENEHESVKKKLNFSSHFFLFLFGSIYVVLGLFGSNIRGINSSNSSRQKAASKLTYIEVTIENDQLDSGTS